ncbi:flap endonuclease GEN isoform X2 [Venturia canescens]|nr:flap endonuclease GEN isoform X2 [Venturia canescens]
MLEFMGLKCVKGSGEAEAMCAYLNADGLVDACISQDSDCFLYGAKTVYRNFCISAGKSSCSGGSVDEYSIEKIERLYQIGRNKMVVMALLCGCDYDDGVSGVGKEAVLKLFKLVDDKDIFDRITSWPTDPKFKQMESKLKDPNICTSCGHEGKVRTHAKSGCADCGTVSKCNDSYKETRALISNEIALRKKALAVEGFPNQELIDEFLVRRDPMPSRLDLQWRQPKILEFVEFMERHVCWEPEYAFAKIFPLTTRWQLRHLAVIPKADRLLMKGIMIPERIKKIRNLKSIASYEVVWSDKDGILEGLTLGQTSDEENSVTIENESNELVSIEPQDAFTKCYPELTEEFESARLAKKKKPAKARKKKALAENEDETTTKKKTAVRRPRKIAAEKGNRKIDDFIQRVKDLEESFEAISIATKRSKPTDSLHPEKPIASGTPKKGPQFDKVLATEGCASRHNDTLGRMFDELTPDDFPSDMENEVYDISEIVDRVCGKQGNDVEFDLRSISALRIEDNEEPNLPTNDENTSCQSQPNNAGIFKADDSFDEFNIVYVPLSERVKLSKEIDPDKKRVSRKMTLGFEDLMNDSDL